LEGFAFELLVFVGMTAAIALVALAAALLAG
jgi:hypothetical protein